MKKLSILVSFLLLGLTLVSCSSKEVKKDNTKKIKQTRQQSSQAFEKLDKETK